MRIGIAGYMGAGKSTCARSLEAGGAVIIDADAVAKTMMSRDGKVTRELQNAFGKTVVDDNGLRFDILGTLAFESIKSLTTLNRIIHPPLVAHLEHLVFDCKEKVCVLDAALIPLWGIESWFDRCIWIDAPFETRFERLKAKRGDINERELAHRMKMQEEIMPAPNAKLWIIIHEYHHHHHQSSPHL